MSTQPPPAPSKAGASPWDKYVGRSIENRYTLVAHIGRGAYGDVWHAEDRIVGEHVAFKWMHTALGDMQPRVRREITTLRLLRFPGVVRLIDDGLVDDKPFLVMELVDGKPFPGRPIDPPASWSDLAAPTLALFETLSHVHAAGVIHRDLKPENVLVRPDGRPVVLDFGISLLHDHGPTHKTKHRKRGGSFAGSPLYMAPEQISSDEIDARADLYAVGLMLYEALTGQVPHSSQHLGPLFQNRLTQPVRPVQELAPALPTVVASVINRLLCTHAADRFESAAAVLAALRGESMTANTMLAFLGARDTLDEMSLRALFVGPDRLFHLREDAARALWTRTNGDPEQIELELLSWIRMGLARRDGNVFIVDREALGRLQTGLVGVRVAKIPPSDVILDDTDAKSTLRWLSLAGCALSMTQLATLMQCAPFRVEAVCQGLLQRGMIQSLDGDRYEIRWRIHVDHDEQQRVQAHRAIAFVLTAGDDMRLYHLLAAGLSLDAARESVHVAARHATAGNVAVAIALLAEGLRAARDERAFAEEKAILVLWAKTALAEGTARATDRVLYEIARTGTNDVDLSRLDTLLRAAIAAPGAGGINALEMADELGRLTDPELERWRHRIRVTAVAVRASAPLIAEVLEEVEDWVDQGEEPLAELSLAEGRARQRYHEGRFEDAAALFSRAATLETSTPARIEATLRSASALLEAFRREEAMRAAEEARAIAAQLRNPYWESRAEWLLRSVQYRSGQTDGADMELVDAVALVGAENVEALVCLNEAATAMRANLLELARNLAERAATIWRGLGRPYATMMARAVAIACGAAADENEVDVLAERAMTCNGPGLGIQALGLLGRVFPEKRALWQHAIPKLVQDVPRAHWHERMDVLSVNEAWEGATGNDPGERP